MTEEVILVNKKGEDIGVCEKMKAHQNGGLLHRAFSVFVLNDANELMIHKRAKKKYHSGGLWTNTCCSHPRKNESVIDAGKRRLKEEMGFSCELEEAFHFIYEAILDNELTEHEYDHVLIGRYNKEPKINLEEVEDWKWVSLRELVIDMSENMEDYTIWFRIALPNFIAHLQKELN